MSAEAFVERHVEHTAAVTGAVILSVAALEAWINEFFADAGHEDGSQFIRLGARQQALIAGLWERGIPRTARYSILEKYQIALVALGRTAISESSQPHQDASALIRLRNALVHFEPQFEPMRELPDDQAEMTKFERLFRKRFPLNPHVSRGAAFFPGLCLSAGCAEWSVRTAYGFMKQFHELFPRHPGLRRLRTALVGLGR